MLDIRIRNGNMNWDDVRKLLQDRLIREFDADGDGDYYDIDISIVEKKKDGE